MLMNYLFSLRAKREIGETFLKHNWLNGIHVPQKWNFLEFFLVI